MGHIRETDREHTVLMMQVENEVGILRDSRDRSPAANRAFAGPVPQRLMDFVVRHKDELIPEFRDVWKANGSRTSGTWEEVFGPGKPDSVDLPVRTTSPPMDRNEHDKVAWRKLYWPVDEIFMAWNYACYVGKVAAAGKAEYAIPMYANAWLQQPDHAWPGTYPCGGPVPQVIDVWHAGAPSIDILAPDLYITSHFDEVVKRFTRAGNPLFIPETNSNGANALIAFVDDKAIGFSPFAIDRGMFGFGPAGPPRVDSLAQTYSVLAYLTPEVAQCQADGTMVRLPPVADGAQGEQEVKPGDFTLMVRNSGGGVIGGRPAGRGGFGGDPPGGGFGRGGGAPAGTPPAQPPTQPPLPDNAFPGALVLMPRANEYVIAGAGLHVSFKAKASPDQAVKLGYFEESLYADGRWYRGRRLNGDQTGNNTRWPGMATGFGIYRVAVY